MLYRATYLHLPIDQIARSYPTDAASALKLARSWEKAGEPQVMLEDKDGVRWTPDQFAAIHGL